MILVGYCVNGSKTGRASGMMACCVKWCFVLGSVL